MRIVAFPYHDWRKADLEGIRWRDAHLLEHLGSHAAVDGVLVIDRPTSLPERIRRQSSKRARGWLVASTKIGRSLAMLTQVAPSTMVLDVAVPDVIGPIRDRYRWWFTVFSNEDVLASISWAVDLTTPREERVNVIAWTPTVGPAIERLNPRRILYDSLDNWLLHPQLRAYAGLAAPAYESILERADNAWVSAPRSQDALARWHAGIEIVPNGVDPARFAAETQRPSDLPKGLIVGYAGSVGPRIDEGLVRAVARELTDVDFVFVGQVLDRAMMKRLEKEPNVSYLGDRHYDTVPSYIRHFDVAWIPHSIGAGESGGDPIKMYEYWAADRQVVATRIDGLDHWADRLHLVDAPTDAARVIRGLLDGSTASLNIGVPESRTWAAIAQRAVERLGGT